MPMPAPKWLPPRRKLERCCARAATKRFPSSAGRTGAFHSTFCSTEIAMHHFAYRGGVLHAEAVSLGALADSVGTPFYCYSTATLERHYRVFADAFAGAPDTLVCFSIKANSNLGVLATLARQGAGMDVVSEGELRRALGVRVPPDKIVFSGVGKTREEMAFALDTGT